MLLIALVELGIGEPVHILRTTARALHIAVRPPHINHELSAVLKVRKVDNRLLKSFGCGVIDSHEENFTLKSSVSQVYYCPKLGGAAAAASKWNHFL